MEELSGNLPVLSLMEKRNNVKADVITRVDNVTLRRNGKTILSNIDWNINNREHWVIFGQNGSGKTMLLKLLMGYEWPSEGTISVLGNQFGEIDLRELRKTIGFVSSALQQEMQQQISVFEVVLSGYFASIGLYEKPPVKVRKKAQELMKFLEINTLAKQLFPLLSYGEQKRVLIARSLMHDPQLLILDEPCSGLDIRSREHFLSFIERLGNKKTGPVSPGASRGGPTIIFVTHHIEEITPCFTHILCLKNGKVVQSGRKEDILTPKIIGKTLDMNIDIQKHDNRYTLSFPRRRVSN